jgi:hypothetical protein
MFGAKSNLVSEKNRFEILAEEISSQIESQIEPENYPEVISHLRNSLYRKVSNLIDSNLFEKNKSLEHAEGCQTQIDSYNLVLKQINCSIIKD